MRYPDPIKLRRVSKLFAGAIPLVRDASSYRPKKSSAPTSGSLHNLMFTDPGFFC
jgi:hypothetical protein